MDSGDMIRLEMFASCIATSLNLRRTSFHEFKEYSGGDKLTRDDILQSVYNMWNNVESLNIYGFSLRSLNI